MAKSKKETKKDAIPSDDVQAPKKVKAISAQDIKNDISALIEKISKSEVPTGKGNTIARELKRISGRI